MSLSLGSRFWGSCNAVILTLPDRGVANAFVVAGDTDLMLAHSFREFPRSKTLTLYLVACDGWRPFTRTFFSSGDALPLSFFPVFFFTRCTRRWWLIFLGVLFPCATRSCIVLMSKECSVRFIHRLWDWVVLVTYIGSVSTIRRNEFLEARLNFPNTRILL